MIRRAAAVAGRPEAQVAPEEIDTLVIGAGQAGIAASAHLSAAGIPHLVVERARIAENWRSRRWDSLVTNGPAWHDRFPGQAFAGDPDAFPGKEEVADYFVRFAGSIEAPIRTGVEVREVRRNPQGAGFRVATSQGELLAARVIVATGAFQRPLIPPMVPESAGLMQLHSADYRNPAQLPPGGVLVVGAGSSGAQIAEELLQAGRRVWLSVGPHGRPPRRYRTRDFTWWLGVLNLWDAESAPETEHVTIAVSGASGGRTVDFRRLAAEGMVLVGRTAGFADGVMRFAGDLKANLDRGDADHRAVLDRADAWVARNAYALPEDPDERRVLPDPACVTDPVLSLDLVAEGLGTILWATGFGFDFGWLKFDILDPAGRPRHQRGVSAEPGIYFLGLPWQARRGSSFIWGVWHDARHVVEHIVKLRGYLSYRAPGEAR